MTVTHGACKYSTRIEDIYLIEPVVLRNAFIIEGKPARYAVNPEKPNEVYVSLLLSDDGKWGGWVRAINEYDVKTGRTLYEQYKEKMDARKK